MKAKEVNSLEHFLMALGRIYNAGVTVHTENLYPKVSYPVPTGTPMIGPLVKWDFSQDWLVISDNTGKDGVGISCTFIVDPYSIESEVLSDSTSVTVQSGSLDSLKRRTLKKILFCFLFCSFLFQAYKFLQDHVIDGRMLFPFTGYPVMAWRALARFLGQEPDKTPVVLEDIRINRPIHLNGPGIFFYI